MLSLLLVALLALNVVNAVEEEMDDEVDDPGRSWVPRRKWVAPKRCRLWGDDDESMEDADSYRRRPYRRYCRVCVLNDIRDLAMEADPGLCTSLCSLLPRPAKRVCRLAC